MPDSLDGHVHCGRGRHVRACREDAWATLPDTPVWQALPYLDDGMKLKATSPPFQPDTNFRGGVDTRIAIQHKDEIAGSFQTLAWVPVFCFLMHAALDRNAADNYDLYSYVFDHYTPPDPRRYAGVVVETWRVTATGTGDVEIRVGVDLRGQREVIVAAMQEGDYNPLAADFDYDDIPLVPFMQSHAVLELDTVHVADVENWELTVTNNLEIGPFVPHDDTEHSVVSYIRSCTRRIELSLTKLNRTDEFNAALRAGTPLSFEVGLYHPLGYLAQIQLPRLIVPESEEDGTASRLARETPSMLATSYERPAIIYGCEPDLTTTTLAGLTTTSHGATTTTAAATTTTEAATTTTAAATTTTEAAATTTTEAATTTTAAATTTTEAL